jgi:diguanylate cyclase (GGDEF)-like protein
MKYSDLNIEVGKSFNIFYLVIYSSAVFIIINSAFYTIKPQIIFFQLFANAVLLLTTLYLIYITQKHSTNKSGFYYYTSIGFSFVFYGLFIITLDTVFVYVEEVVNIASKLLFVCGYSLLTIGVTKWVRYNENRQDELSYQANTDELTGILNRRSFTKYIEHEFKHAKMRSEPFSLIIIDIDFFKDINDNYGHIVGDEILKNLSQLMKSSFRTTDKVCRWGGEEFAILLPSTSMINANNVAEKMRLKVENVSHQVKDKSINYTISLGVSESLAIDETIDQIINRADTALYKAKDGGRNCVRAIRT